jgi:hypothetical protein
MLSILLTLSGIVMVACGLWSTRHRGMAIASFAAPLGLVVFVVGLVRLLLPYFFPF